MNANLQGKYSEALARQKSNFNGYTYYIFFAFIFFVYITFSGGGLFLGPNDGCHFAQTKAIFEEGTFVLDSYKEYAGVDLAKYGKYFYSSKPPGAAFIALPFYGTGKVFSVFLSLPETFYRDYKEEFEKLWRNSLRYSGTKILEIFIKEQGEDHYTKAFVTSASALSGVLSVFMLFLVCRKIGFTDYSSILGCLSFAFGTINWKYSTVFFSHTLSTLFLLLSTYLALKIAVERKTRYLFLLLGFALGYSVLLAYQALLFIPPFLIYVIYSDIGWFRRKVDIIKYGYLLLGLVVPVGLLMYFDYVCFGSPFTPANTYTVAHPFNRAWSLTFSGSILKGIKTLLIGWQDKGLFIQSPILFFSLIGAFHMLRRIDLRKETLLFIFIFLPLFVLIAAYRGRPGTNDTRYLLPVIPVMVIFLIYFIDRFFIREYNPLLKVLFEVVFYALFFASVLINFIDLILLIPHPGPSFNDVRTAMLSGFAKMETLTTSRDKIELIIRIVVLPFLKEGWGGFLKMLFPALANFPVIIFYLLLIGSFFVLMRKRIRSF